MATSKPHPPIADRPALAGASGHNLALDGVRGLAILLVLWTHTTIVTAPDGPEGWYKYFTGIGGFGVDLFFVLSGFLITGILHDSKDACAGHAGGKRRYFGNFYARRTLRIFPLYYAVLFIWCFVLPNLTDIVAMVASGGAADAVRAAQPKIDGALGVDEHAPWFWAYLSNVPIAMTNRWVGGPMLVSWSLAIEEQFYLVWPLLVWALSRRAMMKLCIAAVGIALLSRSAIVLTYFLRGQDAPALPFLNPEGAYVLTFCRIDTLALGALIALGLRGSIGIESLARIAKRVLAASLLVAAAMLVVDWRIEGLAFRPTLSDGSPLHLGAGPLFRSIGLTVVALIGAAALVLAITSKPGSLWNRLWTNSVMRTFGKFAYGLYLLHSFVSLGVRWAVFGPEFREGGNPLPPILDSHMPAQIAYSVAMSVVFLAVAWVSWTVFENPILKLKKFFPSGCEAPPRR